MGISAHQLSRVLKVQYKRAWRLAHRIREASRSADLAPFGSNGGIVEADETFMGRIKGAPVKRSFDHKMQVCALIDQDSGQAHTMVIDHVSASNIVPIIRANVGKGERMTTDERPA